ncbi:hypothetical protein Mapa_012317 [Marchantia paleacea]|nr:hypothetical protein Mapa_012317 [Marchantia paleacea]
MSPVTAQSSRGDSLTLLRNSSIHRKAGAACTVVHAAPETVQIAHVVRTLVTHSAQRC